MGKVSDKKTVVDSQLRVLNTIGLRVADNSIQPVIVNANTNAPAILIGEKAADFIRDFWFQQYQVYCLLISYLLGTGLLQSSYTRSHQAVNSSRLT
ncbi:unnamed protein product, partial [Allacma fusca]